MFDIFKTPIKKVDSIDFTFNEGRFNTNYWGLILVDSKDAMYYFSEDGTCIYILSTGDVLLDEGKFSTFELLTMLRQNNLSNPASRNSVSHNPEVRKLDVQTLTQLRAGGHTLEDILRLHKEGVL